MEFTEVIRNRYSCKKYDSNKQVSKEQLDAILEAGRVAPTVLVVVFNKNDVYTYPNNKLANTVSNL